MKKTWSTLMCLPLLLACPADEPTTMDGADETTAGEGDGDTAGDGDGDSAGEGDGDTSGDGDGDGDPDCTGPLGTQSLPDPLMQPATPTEPGSTWAYFEVTDFQPQSCNFGETYSLETFKGRVTLFILVRATCEICQGTVEKLEQMQLELQLAGHEVWFVALNQAGYDDFQQELIDRASFPLLQDTAEADGWGLMNDPGLGTDDIYIYDAEGLLHSYFVYDASIDLDTPEGWDTIYNALLAALGA